MEPVATYAIVNVKILIFNVNHLDGEVLAGANYEDSEWFDINEDSEGFIWGGFLIPFDQCKWIQ